MKRKLLLLVLTMLMMVSITACGSSDKKEAKESGSINVYNAGEYIDPQILNDFEKETGIKVVYDTFASNEDLYIKLTQSTDSFDVVVPSDYMIERLIKEDKLQKINFDNIPNYKGISAGVKKQSFDPNDEYSVPYFSGTLGIIYNTKAIDSEITSWKDLWNPKYKGQIIMYNSQRDTIAIALKMLGYSLNSVNDDELNKAKEQLIAQKPLVYAYLTDDGKDVIVQGDAAIGVMYSGDAALMVKDNPDLKYVIPQEGSNVWIDSLVIPKSAKNVAGAEKFIDYLCRPEVAAKNAEYLLGYTSPIDAAKELLPEELRKSEVAYPDYSKLPKLEAFKDLGDNVQKYDKIWTEISATIEQK